MVAAPHYYREWLREKIEQLKSRNSNLSLTAFAHLLKISPTSLSQIISGKRPLSLRIAHQIADYFGLSPSERQELLLGAVGSSALKVSSRLKFSRTKPKLKLKDLGEKDFDRIADWHYFAILSLSNVKNNCWSSDWISKRLSLSAFESESAMKALEDLKLIEVFPNKTFRQTEVHLSIGSGISRRAIRHFHQKNLTRASQSLENDTIWSRDFSSVTFAIKMKDLTSAQDQIQRFRRRFWKTYGQENGQGEEVYTLNIQLFPQTKIRKANIRS